MGIHFYSEVHHQNSPRHVIIMPSPIAFLLIGYTRKQDSDIFGPVQCSSLVGGGCKLHSQLKIRNL